MTSFQWIIYIIGIISFIIGCFFYYISKNENHSNRKKILKWIPEGTHDFNKYIKPEELQEYVLENKLKLSKW